MAREPAREFLRERPADLLVAGSDERTHLASRGQHCGVLCHVALTCREPGFGHPAVFIAEVAFGMGAEAIDALKHPLVGATQEFFHYFDEFAVLVIYGCVA